jgi:hypothetical protein
MSVKTVGGLASGLVACALAYGALHLEQGPYGGWLFSFLVVLAAASTGVMISKAARWRPFGVSLAVAPLVMFAPTIIVVAATGIAVAP